MRFSFALYLVGLASLPFKWVSPFSYAQAGWSDVFFAAAFAAWVLERMLRRDRPRLRAPHYWLAAYVLTVVLSATFAPDRASAARNALITCELVVIALLTADFVRSPGGRIALVRVIFAVVVVAGIEGAVGLLLFYLGEPNSLVGGATNYFSTSSWFTRVSGGFYSAPLLGSFCIFASAVLAVEDRALPRRARVVGQVVLALLVVATASRAAIAFAVAFVIREAHRRGTFRARRGAIVVAMLGAVALAVLSLAPLSLDPLRPSSTPAGINSRLANIESASATLVHHPYLGTGPGSLAASWDGQPYRAHFTPLNVAATTGLPSLVALSGFIVLLWRRRRRPTHVALWSGLAGLCLDALTQDVEHFRHVWIMLGLADADGSSSLGSEGSRVPDRAIA